MAEDGIERGVVVSEGEGDCVDGLMWVGKEERDKASEMVVNESGEGIVHEGGEGEVDRDDERERWIGMMRGRSG